MHSICWIAFSLLVTPTTGCAAHRAADIGAVVEALAIEAAAQLPTVETEPHAHSGPVSSWPGFRGPNRDGVYPEPIRLSWEGLAPMWKKPIGGGRSSFAVADGRAFTLEQRLRNEVVVAYDVMTGRELWTNAWPERFSQWMGGGEGPRATPAWADGFVFALGARGELRCLDAVSGRLVWRTNILQDTGAKNLRWGMAGSPLIAGDAVIVLPGGQDHQSVAAYDRRTGKRLWTALNDKQAYASPMQVTLLGVPQFLVVSAERVVGLSPDQRAVLWEFPWVTDHDASAAQPIVIGNDRVFYSSGYGAGAAVFELTKAGDRFAVRQVWRNIRMKNRASSSVLHEGFIYGLDEGILACVDVLTGELKWKGGRYGHGQVLLAGHHLVVITEDGELVLVAPTPEKLQELARVPAIDGETWNVPAFAGGILLVRNTQEMAAFDLRPGAATPTPLPSNASGDTIPNTTQLFSPAQRAGRLFRLPSLPGLVKKPVVLFERQAAAPAPLGATAGTPGRELFVSWGYNGDRYAKSDMHFSQPSLGNDFALVGVEARDSKAWTSLFSHGLFVPQYNFRIGVFFNERWGLELAFDHLKWIVKQDQQIRMTGTLNGAPVDTPVTLTPDVLRYQLNNGANPIFVNLIRRVRLAGEPGRTGHVSFLAKAGGGFAIPHSENMVFGQPNEKGFQFLKGWDMDAVAAVRIHILKPLYFEVEEKLIYARYFGLKVDRGTAKHSVKASEFTFSFGVAFR